MLPPDYQELYEERSAIREYDGNVPRSIAEADALAEITLKLQRDTALWNSENIKVEPSSPSSPTCKQTQFW